MSGRDAMPWRVLDTGVRRAAENFAINRAVLEAHQQSKAPHTIRFLSFEPSALVGFHQDVEQELNLDYIRAHGIDIQRRLTGGGALYFDAEQIGWELYLDKRTLGTADMSAIARRICETAARGLQSLGVDARYRPRNDIEVDGRKISGTGGAFDGDSILYQGTLLIEFDVERMLRVLRIPVEKISDKAISDARERIVTMRELLGDALPERQRIQDVLAGAFADEFGVRTTAGDLNDAERAIFAEALAEIDSEEWVRQHDRPLTDAPLREAMIKTPGGLMRVAALVDTGKRRLKQLWITGDFFVRPRRLVIDLEAALRDSALDELERNVNTFFAERQAEMLMLTPDDFVNAIRRAVEGAGTAT
ncbi:MAG: biotin/lipoate A/B protein ligase family protein [Ectothiorhodospiraceae bacterium]|jgi:lipoate-protein ligase A|nr:biotin/lipoate A/B protein ligase family protein [Ectothiorhodospiraceae bacterium]